MTGCHFTFLPRCCHGEEDMFCWNNIAVRFTEAPALSICGKLKFRFLPSSRKTCFAEVIGIPLSQALNQMIRSVFDDK